MFSLDNRLLLILLLLLLLLLLLSLIIIIITYHERGQVDPCLPHLVVFRWSSEVPQKHLKYFHSLHIISKPLKISKEGLISKFKT